MRVAVSLAPEPGFDPDTATPHGFPRDASAWTAVVVDVLRASTTLAIALSNGARGIEFFAEPAEAIARRDRSNDVLACGERDGRILPGFDLGNSPFEYDVARVSGKRLAFASTNGSLAMLAVAGCRTRWLGAFVSASALRDELVRSRAEWVFIQCAGKEYRFAIEDAAFAGWLCAELEARGAALEGGGARFARSIAPRDANAIRRAVSDGSHAHELRRLGPEYARDVEFCATLDALALAFQVPAAR